MAKVIQNKGCNFLRSHHNFCEFGNACSWSNHAFQNRIKTTIMEEMRVKTPVKTDFVQNVVSGGTRSTTLRVDTQTRNNSPKYILYSYIYIVFQHIYRKLQIGTCNSIRYEHEKHLTKILQGFVCRRQSLCFLEQAMTMIVAGPLTKLKAK
jgi:hypothetical protein